MTAYAAAAAIHAACAVCGDLQLNAASLGLTFRLEGDGSVTAQFQPSSPQQGYPGLVHGGTLATLLDAAMTHCLFARGIRALTAELAVRFVAPARLGRVLVISGRIITQRRRMSQLQATILQEGLPVARATAVFLEPRFALLGPDE